MIHHVLLDECSGLFYAASRENGKVAAFSIDTLKVRAGGLKVAKSNPFMSVASTFYPPIPNAQGPLCPQETHRVDLLASGRVWSLLTKPNGGVLALTWEVDRVRRGCPSGIRG